MWTWRYTHRGGESRGRTDGRLGNAWCLASLQVRNSNRTSRVKSDSTYQAAGWNQSVFLPQPTRDLIASTSHHALLVSLSLAFLYTFIHSSTVCTPGLIFILPHLRITNDLLLSLLPPPPRPSTMLECPFIKRPTQRPYSETFTWFLPINKHMQAPSCRKFNFSHLHITSKGCFKKNILFTHYDFHAYWFNFLMAQVNWFWILIGISEMKATSWGKFMNGKKVDVIILMVYQKRPCITAIYNNIGQHSQSVVNIS